MESILTETRPGLYFAEHTAEEQAQLLRHYHSEALAGRPLSGNSGRDPIYLGNDHCRSEAAKAALLAFCADPANGVAFLCGDLLRQDIGQTGVKYRATLFQMYFTVAGTSGSFSVTNGGKIRR